MKQLFFDFFNHNYLKPVIQFEQEIILRLREKMALAILNDFNKKEKIKNDRK